MGQESHTMSFGIPDILQDEGEGIDRSVWNPYGSKEVGIKAGFQSQGFISAESGCLDSYLLAGAEKSVLKIKAIFGKRDKEPSRFF
jgi:hypothetical protein